MKTRIVAALVGAGLVLALVAGAEAAKNPGGNKSGAPPSHFAPGQFPPGQ